MVSSEFAIALHSMLLLAHDARKLRSSAELAKNLSVHSVRIRRMLGTLKKAGLIISKPGKKGGFVVNAAPEKISLDQIYKLTSKTSLKPKCHVCQKTCSIGANIEFLINDIFNKADASLLEFLKGITLDMLLKRMQNNYIRKL
jgi:Rrf2 family protein